MGILYSSLSQIDSASSSAGAETESAAADGENSGKLAKNGIVIPAGTVTLLYRFSKLNDHYQYSVRSSETYLFRSEASELLASFWPAEFLNLFYYTYILLFVLRPLYVDVRLYSIQNPLLIDMYV